MQGRGVVTPPPFLPLRASPRREASALGVQTGVAIRIWPPCVKGERSERCQWQMQRGERVAAVKISAA